MGVFLDMELTGRCIPPVKPSLPSTGSPASASAGRRPGGASHGGPLVADSTAAGERGASEGPQVGCSTAGLVHRELLELRRALLGSTRQRPLTDSAG